MDSDEQILENLRDVVGCNGVRDWTDLGKIKQKTIEKRLHVARHELSPESMTSIYARWLADQMLRIGGAERKAVVQTWSQFLAEHNCDIPLVLNVWSTCTESQIREATRKTPRDVDRLQWSMDAAKEQLNKSHPLMLRRAEKSKEEKVPSRPESSYSLPTVIQDSSGGGEHHLGYQPPRLPTPAVLNVCAPPRLPEKKKLPRSGPKLANKIDFREISSPDVLSEDTTSNMSRSYFCRRCKLNGKFRSIIPRHQLL